MAAPRKLILDVDTGTDDAIALMLAALHPDLELVAATTVNGNNPIANCTDNTLRVFDLLDVDIPVYEGAATPLLRDDFPIPREILHRDGSMHPRELPIPPPRSVKQSHAVDFLVETYMATTDPITLVPVGPLTNIALAIKLEPRIVDRIPQTVIMGGAHESGNTTPSAEFNVWHDPEAAAIVLGSGVPITMYGLDVFYEPVIERPDAERLAASGEPGARLAGQLLLHQLDRFGTGNLGDAGAVAAVIDPAGLTTAPHRIRVELAGRYTRGETVVDRRTWPSSPEHDEFTSGQLPPGVVDVAFAVDAKGYRRLYLATVARR